MVPVDVGGFGARGHFTTAIIAPGFGVGRVVRDVDANHVAFGYLQLAVVQILGIPQHHPDRLVQLEHRIRIVHITVVAEFVFVPDSARRGRRRRSKHPG